MECTITYGGIKMEAEYSWPGNDIEDLEVRAIRVGGVNVWPALMQAASDGAKAVGNGNGVMRRYGDEALADKLCELIAAEATRAAAVEAAEDAAAEAMAYEEANRA